MSDLEKFVSTSMRGPKRGIYEQLLASLLIKGVRSNDPLIKISCICEAAFMSKKKDKLDMNLVDVFYTVCQSLQNTEIAKSRKSKTEYVNVSWSFPKTEENWKQYIKPWQKTSQLQFYTLFTSWRYNKYPIQDRLENVSPFRQVEHYNELAEYYENLATVIAAEIRDLPPHQCFFEMASALGVHSYRILQGEFTSWALRQLLEIQATLAEEISPQVWKDAFGQPSQETEETEDAD
jgi:hypothetical protein